ncbi:uncharacterized protein B0T23DRAFT_362257 [Neurospora hispaniola]|uniref:SMP-30/Gluconolactonase/LRE-like region domain-containing protein n=1 Tax=Neurospora hispaniola TaxID=588809 RepID=A0AAJ0I3G1_9PEZI|nr:hypothetical protein B0T23DRAFT_362257 [Neurospora hispaniola]
MVHARRTSLAPLLSGATALLLATATAQGNNVPAQAQVINQKSFNVLGDVPPPPVANYSTLFIPPGTTKDSLFEKPFHIYDEEFLDIIGANPTLTLLKSSGTNPMFHEAAVWVPSTDDVFFVQNAGDPAAGTGLNRSAIIQRISLSQVTTDVSAERNATGKVDVHLAVATPAIINPNGATNYRNRILFAGEGQGSRVAPALYAMSPNAPYNATVILDNYFGRQFNSINDVAINPRTEDIYFTDTTYGYVQDFRPETVIQKQVWRFNETSGAVAVAADGFNMPNGITFSPDGQHAYVTDTGVIQGFFGRNSSFPSSIYRYDVEEDGTFSNRKTFAFIATGVPDGVHVDTKGNLYAGCGDGVHVYNPSGKLLGKIWIGSTVANFQFAGKGRMVILAETELYYATLKAEGAFPGQLY